MRPHALAAALLLLALLGACGDDTDTPDADPTPTESSSSSSESPTSDVTPLPAGTEGPVPGSGADLPVDRADRWCGAITPDQLAVAIGAEVTEITPLGGDDETSCSAELADIGLSISWESAPTRKTQQQYAAGFDRPAGIFDVSDVELTGGQSATTVTQSPPATARTAFVRDGRLIEAVVIGLPGDEATTVDDVAAVSEAIVAVYAA